MVMLYCYTVTGQTDWKQKFPNADAVYTNVVRDINIVKQDGKWVAISVHSEELVYLTDKSLRMMSRGRIYHSTFNELKKWDAFTKLNSNKKIKVSNTTTASSTDDYIFYDDTKATSFDFAGAEVNAKRYIEYEILLNDIHLLSPHYFERYFPVAEGEVRITFPSEIKMKYIIKGDHASKVNFSETTKRNKTTWSFKMKDAESYPSFPNAPDNSYYATHVIYYVEQVKENNEWQNFLSSPKDLHSYNYNYIKDLNKNLSTELKTLAEKITAGSGSDEEKARRIYRWVQTNIKYVAFEDGLEGFIPRDASLVCNRRYGDCKDMSSVLTAMLNHVGVPAYFTWIGTRDIPYDYTEVPLPIVDNHMICAIKLNNEFVFLDGTDNGCIFGFPPSAIQGKQAMISMGENKFEIVRVPVIEPSRNINADTTFFELTENGIIGRISVNLTGYLASDLYSTLNARNEKDHNDYFKARLERANNKIKFKNWKWNITDDHNNATISADFELPDFAKQLNNEWFLNMNMARLFENIIVEEKRKMAITYSYQSTYRIVTALKIPDGYKLTYLPPSDSLYNDAWGFNLQYSVEDNTIYLTQEFVTDKLMTMPHQFADLNKVTARLSSNYKQTIVLSKK